MCLHVCACSVRVSVSVFTRVCLPLAWAGGAVRQLCLPQPPVQRPRPACSGSCAGSGLTDRLSSWGDFAPGPSARQVQPQAPTPHEDSPGPFPVSGAGHCCVRAAPCSREREACPRSRLPEHPASVLERTTAGHDTSDSDEGVEPELGAGRVAPARVSCVRWQDFCAVPDGAAERRLPLRRDPGSDGPGRRACPPRPRRSSVHTPLEGKIKAFLA